MPRVGRAEVGQVQPSGLAQLNGVAQHGVEGEQKRHLDDERQASAHRVDVVLLVERGDLLVHLRAARVIHLVLLVFLLDGLNVGRRLLHLHRALDLRDAQRQQREVDQHGHQHDRPAPVRSPMLLRPAHPGKQRTADEAEDSKVERAGQVGAVHAMHRVENVHGLRAGEQADVAGAVQASGGHTQHVGLCLITLRVRGVFRDFNGVAQLGVARVLRINGKEECAEVSIAGAHPLVATSVHPSSADAGAFFVQLEAGDVLAGGDEINALFGVAGHALRVAKAGGPGRQGRYPLIAAAHAGLDANDVALVEAELLLHGHVAVGVLKAHILRRGAGGGRSADVEHRVQLLAQCGVVAPQAERVAVLAGRLLMHQFQAGPPVVVLVLFQDPALHLRAAVGEGDPVQIVLHNGVAFGGGCNGGGRLAGWNDWRCSG